LQTADVSVALQCGKGIQTDLPKKKRERRGYGGDCGWCKAKQKDSTPLKAIRASTCLGRQPLS